jgi:hypothetical protein
VRVAALGPKPLRLADLAPADTGVPARRPGYRIEVFGKPRSPWRLTVADAMADAVAAELASWDAERGEHFLAVPVELRLRHAPS